MTAVYVEEGPDKGAIWHFGEPAKEQRALDEGKAWADLSHLSVVAVSGDDLPPSGEWQSASLGHCDVYGSNPDDLAVSYAPLVDSGPLCHVPVHLHVAGWVELAHANRPRASSRRGSVHDQPERSLSGK